MIDHVDENNDLLMVRPHGHIAPIFEVGSGTRELLTDSVGSITIPRVGTVHGSPTTP